MKVFNNPQQLMKFQILFDGGLAILLLLARLEGPARARDIARLCSIGEHTAGRHLQRLLDLGLVQQSSQGYRLAPGALDGLLPPEHSPDEQPVDPAVDPAAEQPPAVPETTDADVEQTEQPPSALPPKNVKINHFSAAAAVKYSGLKNNKQVLTAAAAVTATRNVGQPPRAGPRADSELPVVLQALSALGIGEPKRSQLARQPGMTAGFVQAWAAHLQATHRAPYSPGLLIHVLALGEPPPEAPDPDHPPGCACRVCLLGEYLCPDCGELPCTCLEAEAAG